MPRTDCGHSEIWASRIDAMTTVSTKPFIGVVNSASVTAILHDQSMDNVARAVDFGVTQISDEPQQRMDRECPASDESSRLLNLSQLQKARKSARQLPNGSHQSIFSRDTQIFRGCGSQEPEGGCWLILVFKNGKLVPEGRFGAAEFVRKSSSSYAPRTNRRNVQRAQGKQSLRASVLYIRWPALLMIILDRWSLSISVLNVKTKISA
jgi:hypothetical protein